ncbi:MAG: hypothetical protein SNJ85_06510 [Cyanobacteriota bacterium]
MPPFNSDVGIPATSRGSRLALGSAPALFGLELFVCIPYGHEKSPSFSQGIHNSRRNQSQTKFKVGD